MLNGVATVDPGLATRVWAAADDLEYRRNGVARNLRRQRADIWALIVADLENPFFTEVARGVEDSAQRADYSVLLCNSDEEPEKEAAYIAVAEGQRVSGVIISPNGAGTDLSRLHAAGVPVVAIDRPLPDAVGTVLANSREGACKATTHLLAEGWARPACITGPAHIDTAEQRRVGYLDALRGHRVPTRPDVRHGDYRADTSATRSAIASLLEQHTPPDAFFVANSTMALALLDELNQRDLRPGHDVGLIAFDDAPWAALVHPPMSVVIQPARNIGLQAAKMLLEQRNHDNANVPCRTEILPTSLRIRASSRRVRSSPSAERVR